MKHRQELYFTSPMIALQRDYVRHAEASSCSNVSGPSAASLSACTVVADSMRRQHASKAPKQTLPP